MFKRKFDINLVVNKDGLYLDIGYNDGEYYITTYNEAILRLHIWNNDGISLNHCLSKNEKNKKTRNFQGIKLLEEYKWMYTDEYFYMSGKSELFKFENNVVTNLENSYKALLGLIKNGFKIKL